MRPRRPKEILDAFAVVLKVAGSVSGKRYFNPMRHILILINFYYHRQREGLVELDRTGTGADESLAGCPGKPHMSVFNCQTDQNNSSII